MMKKSYRFITVYKLDLINLKQLGRFRKNIKQRTCLKIQLISYVNQIFLELQYFLKSDLNPKAVHILLKKLLRFRALLPCI